jgi:ATP adenylyltransferase
MDHIFTPWRYAYITQTDKLSECLFCAQLQMNDDAKALIVHRGRHCFVILNAFPYTAGHVMIAPYDHVDQLQKLSVPGAQEMMVLTQKMEGILRDLYKPDGLNLGMNLGKAAGAGVAGHIHMHILPRWIADASFVSVIGETRLIPETLETTYTKIKAKFENLTTD